MRVGIIGEFSGIIRDEFIKRGHDAISCDLEPTEKPGPHIQGDCKQYDWSGYDLIIAHPPCTYLSLAGNRAMKEDKTGQRKLKRFEAFDFFMWIYFICEQNKKYFNPENYGRKIKPKICIENPKGYINSHFRKPDQIIQPYYFGDSEMKTTCLWLRGLPPLIHAEQDELFFKKTHTEKPEPKYQHKQGKKKGQNVYFVESLGSNSKARSRTFPRIAAAMAEQWGDL